MIASETGFYFLILLTLCGGMILNVYLSNQPVNEAVFKKSKMILYIGFSLCFIWPLFNLVVYFIAPEYKVMVGIWGTWLFLQIVWNFFAFASGTLLSVFHYRFKTEHKWDNKFLLGLKVVGLAVLLFISNVLCSLLDEGNYYSFSSPDNTHTIVVHERIFFKTGTLTVYERMNPLIICAQGAEEIYEIFPVMQNDYSINWNQDSVTFCFDNGRNEEKSILVLFD